MTEALNPDDAKNLLKLCKAGRLYDVERWIADGNSLRLKRTPLSIAIDLGFHSLVEFLARNVRQKDKGDAMPEAAARQRLDLIELLFEQGADVHAVRFGDVLLPWDPKIIRFFLDHGADVLVPLPGQSLQRLPYDETQRSYCRGASAQVSGKSTSRLSQSRNPDSVLEVADRMTAA